MGVVKQGPGCDFDRLQDLAKGLYQRAHEIILFWDAKLFHSGSNSGTPWHLKKGLSHALVGIMHFVQMVLNFDKMSQQINHDLQNADGVIAVGSGLAPVPPHRSPHAR